MKHIEIKLMAQTYTSARPVVNYGNFPIQTIHIEDTF